MKTLSALTLLLAAGLALPGCGESGSDAHDHAGDDTHTHADGTTHDDHADDAADDHMDDDHAHDEVALGTAMVGDMEIEAAQGHGAVEAGKESHLVVKLPYNDNGASIVRAWIGTDDPTLSFVGKGEYAPSHDDYDIHATAPDPLPEDAMWWIEVTKPDGTSVMGSIAPITD